MRSFEKEHKDLSRVALVWNEMFFDVSMESLLFIACGQKKLLPFKSEKKHTTMYE
jgi:hypothetical protein